MPSDEIVQLVHGAGGERMEDLIRRIILPTFKIQRVGEGVGLPELDDGASIPIITEQELVATIDAHTVSPIFFPGGNIGHLAAAGTINDLAVMGARPLALLDAIVVEEGFSTDKLQAIVQSLNQVAESVGVAVIGGDFKVVEKGNIDQIVITTAGIGIAPRGQVVTDAGAKPGDKIIVTGPIAEHGIAILASRVGIELLGDLRSDVRPIWRAIDAALKVGGIHAMKDPTRGGLAAALNDIAEKSRVGMLLEEERIPLREPVRAAAELLGVDPLELTCEGVALVIVDPEYADDVLSAIRKTPEGSQAEIIGEVTEGRDVLLKTVIGGRRFIDKPIGEPVPRVC